MGQAFPLCPITANSADCSSSGGSRVTLHACYTCSLVLHARVCSVAVECLLVSSVVSEALAACLLAYLLPYCYHMMSKLPKKRSASKTQFAESERDIG